MAAGPTAIVTQLLEFANDPNNANNTLISWQFELLFCGPVPLAEQGQVSVANTSTKLQVKTAINNAMIASALDKGFVLNVNRIFTIADFAG
jgi:hypothetical protein